MPGAPFIDGACHTADLIRDVSGQCEITGLFRRFVVELTTTAGGRTVKHPLHLMPSGSHGPVADVAQSAYIFADLGTAVSLVFDSNGTGAIGCTLDFRFAVAGAGTAENGVEVEAWRSFV